MSNKEQESFSIREQGIRKLLYMINRNNKVLLFDSKE